MKTKEEKARNRLLAVLFVGVLMGALDIAVVGPALPAIQRFFGVGDRSLAWVFSLYVLSFLVGTPLMAKLSDLHGRRRVYVADILLFGAGSLIVALSPRFEVLLAGRAIQGFGAGGIFPVASAAIGDTFPPEKRGGALGLIGAVFGLAFVIGPVLGGVLLRLGWQWLFLVNLPVAAVVVILALRVVPQRKQEKTAPFDWPGMLSLGAALAGLAFGINGIRAESFLASLTGLRVLPFLAAAAALLILFGRLERRAPDPVVRPDLLRGRQRALAMTLAGGAGIAEAGLVYVPTLAVAALGVEHSTASYLLLPLVVAMAIASPAVGRLLDRIGSRSVILTGTLLLAAGLALLGGLARSLVLFVVAGALIGLGLSSLLGAPLRYIMLAEAAPRDRSAAQGVLAVGTSVGQLVGASAVSAVAASLGGGARGYGVAYLLVAGVCLLLFLGAWGRNGRRAEQEAAAGEAGGPGPHGP